MNIISKNRSFSIIILVLFFLNGCASGARTTKFGRSDSGKSNAYSSYQANQLESEVLSGVNAARVSGFICGGVYFPPVGKLRISQELSIAAMRQARAMASGNFFSHVGVNGDTSADRISATGYTWRVCGENIAFGQTTPKQVVAGWLKSPGHCKNIMNGDFQDMGVAHAKSKKTTYWAQTFGAR